MADDHDDLLNFEIADGDYADGTLNEDELLLSDEDRDDFDDVEKSPEQVEKSVETVAVEPENVEEPPETSAPTEDPADTGQTEEKPQDVPPSPAPSETQPGAKDDSVPPSNHQSMPSRQPFRQKFQRWPNQGPRWNNHPMGPQQQMPPYQRQTGPVMRMPMMQGGPPQRQMRPGFTPQRPPFFNNNFMPGRPPMQRQRFFYPNSMGGGGGPPSYVPTPIMAGAASGPAMPRKVLINPNFKGGVEAAKSQLMKDQFFSSTSAAPEDELLRKQQEFINHNMRQIEKRRHERTPSPKYRRYSHSPSPPRYRRRGPFRNNDRRRDSNGNEGKMKDENQPEEDEETRAYRQQIESQRKKREEILKQKELRRKQLAEKAKEVVVPTEPLLPIVVTDKKIVLKRKTPERSTTPPIKEAPITPTRRIVLKPSKGVVEAKAPSLDDGSKRKIRKILNS